MGIYKLTHDAEEDLNRIWLRGLREYGPAQADNYFNALFERFEEIAANPYHYQAVEHIRKGYRRSPCGVDTIYYYIDDETVVIANIIGRQDIEEWL